MYQSSAVKAWAEDHEEGLMIVAVNRSCSRGWREKELENIRVFVSQLGWAFSVLPFVRDS